MIRELLLETLDIIFSALELRRGKYKRIILIGKSLGTVLQGKIHKKKLKKIMIFILKIFI